MSLVKIIKIEEDTPSEIVLIERQLLDHMIKWFIDKISQCKSDKELGAILYALLGIQLTRLEAQGFISPMLGYVEEDQIIPPKVVLNKDIN